MRRVGNGLEGLATADGMLDGQWCGRKRWNGFGHGSLYGAYCQLSYYMRNGEHTPSGPICRSTSSHLTAVHNFLTNSPGAKRPC